MRRRSKTSSLNVLFIGNSFTARNDVPGLIAALANARGVNLRHRLISAGGASLRRHWNKGDAVQAIRAGISSGEAGNGEPWHHVVLQEQSTLPIKNPTRMHESIRLFDEAIRAGGAKTALYLTWARRSAPPDAQQAITDAYTSIGREIGATVVPVGIAWQRVLAAREDKHSIVLHDKDHSHPTLAGSYLAACVFFATLFNESPVGIAADMKGLTPGEAVLLQRAASSTLRVKSGSQIIHAHDPREDRRPGAEG